MNEQIKALLAQADTKFPGRERTDRDVLEWLKDAVTVLLRAELERQDNDYDH